MRWRYLAIALFYTAQASALAGALPAQAQVQDQPPQSSAPPPPAPEPQVQPAPDASVAPPEASPTAAAPEATPEPADPALAVPPPSAPADSVVAVIRTKLADPESGKGAHADDLAALKAFYEARTGAALWITEMGFSAKGHQALFEIEKAGDWGLDAASFELPPADALPATPEAQALAEIKLDLAILKYARFARGGRLSPSKVSALFDQTPPLRDPKTVLSEIEASDAPDAYLRSLHPKHEQFVHLRQALLEARGTEEEGAKPADDGKDIKRILMNMERWRWMPEELGRVHVLNNSAAFMLHVIKDGKTIFADKTLVGTIGYATPVFTSPMTTIVFNPDWNAPETVVKENILPPLQRKSYSILKTHKLYVSYNGQTGGPDQGRLEPRQRPRLHLFAEGRAPQQSRQGEVPLSQPAHRLHARHAPGAEEILQADGTDDRS